MGNFCGFVASSDDATSAAAAIEAVGGREVKTFPDLGLIVGLIKSSAPGDGKIKLHQIESLTSFEVIESDRR